MNGNRLRNITQKISKGKTHFKYIKYPIIPQSSSDMWVMTTVGDRLDTLAHQFYRDQRLWWIIAQANPSIIRRDSYKLKPYLEIRIPSNIASILGKFDQINN